MTCNAPEYTVPTRASAQLLPPRPARVAGNRGGSGFNLAPPPWLSVLWVTLFFWVRIPASHAATGTIADVQHVVIFIQENRSFDEYLGAHKGVRGFNDPTALVFQNTNTDFYQPNG